MARSFLAGLVIWLASTSWSSILSGVYHSDGMILSLHSDSDCVYTFALLRYEIRGECRGGVQCVPRDMLFVCVCVFFFFYLTLNE
jgi:hypothetical protein